MIAFACYGDSVSTIAATMGISQHTVHTYRTRLYRKLRVGSFCQALAVFFGAYADSMKARDRGSE